MHRVCYKHLVVCDSQIVWDEDTKSWKNTDPDAEDTQISKAPPPKDSELPGGPSATPGPGPPPGMMAGSSSVQATPATGMASPPMGSNRFSRQKIRGNGLHILVSGIL